VLDQLGLVGALRQLVSALSSGADGQFTCDVDAPDPMPALPAAAEVAAFRIAQEPLDIFRRYASAYARDQAYCCFSPALIANLERNWDAHNRKT
jgi:thioesterase DpgC